MFNHSLFLSSQKGKLYFSFNKNKVAATFIFLGLSFNSYSGNKINEEEINTNQSDHTTPTAYSLYIRDKLSIGVAFGVLNVKAQEYVYYPEDGRQISRLIWHTPASPLGQIQIAYQMTPQVSFNGNLWAVMPRKKSRLDDYDFVDVENPQHRTNWTHHEQTKLKANGFDLYFKYNLIDAAKPYRFALLGGFQNSRFQWIAPAQAYYEYEFERFTGYGNDPGPGISYKQWLRTPYLGLSTGFDYRRLNFDADLKLSSFVHAKILDRHHLRGLLYTEKPITQPRFYSLDLNLSYRITKELSLTGKAGIAYLPSTKTNVERHHMNTPEKKVYTDGGGGLRNLSKTLTIGLKYDF